VSSILTCASKSPLNFRPFLPGFEFLLLRICLCYESPAPFLHNLPLTASSHTITEPIRRSVVRLQTLTLIWMLVEALVALSAAWMARSPALLGFGGDSAIELLSAAVVLRRFRSSHDAQAEERAAKLAGGLLLVLAAFVLFASASALLGHVEPRPSVVGIALLVIAAIGMPLLARQKRQLAKVTGSAALKADAAESAVCGYLAWIALAGLIVNAVWRVRWADPVAALALLPLIVREAWGALEGKPCCDG